LIEAAGISTITLSNVPALTASVSVPRIAAIEHPFGRTLGNPGDRDLQIAILRRTLNALRNIDQPGGIQHLPFVWIEQLGKQRSDHHVSPPIAKYLARNPWHLPKLMSREIPSVEN